MKSKSDIPNRADFMKYSAFNFIENEKTHSEREKVGPEVDFGKWFVNVIGIVEWNVDGKLIWLLCETIGKVICGVGDKTE